MPDCAFSHHRRCTMEKLCFSPARKPLMTCCPEPLSTVTPVAGIDAPAVNSTAFPVANRIGSSRRLLGTCKSLCHLMKEAIVRPCLLAVRSQLYKVTYFYVLFRS